MSGFPLLSAVYVVACIFGFWFGANWLVDASVRIARKIGMPELIIGLTIVAVGTSAPEFAVSIGSALRGELDISVGNIVGSNIFNVGFILGGLAAFKAVATTRNLVYRDGTIVILATGALLLFMLDGALGWVEGTIFLICLALYILYLIFQREATDEDLTEEPFSWWDIPLLLVGLGVVFVSGRLFVFGASNIASWFGVSAYVIGVTVVAFGTSAPEIATSAVALLRNHADISAGNLIGSNIFNLLGVLGLAPILSQTVNNQPMAVDLAATESTIVLLILMVIVAILMRTRWSVDRWEGVLLFFIASISWFISFREISILTMLGIW